VPVDGDIEPLAEIQEPITDETVPVDGDIEPPAEIQESDPTEEPRRSGRERRAPGRYEGALATAFTAGERTPRSYREAVTDPKFGSEWQEAIEAELKALRTFNTWKEVEPPKNRNVVSSKWVFTIKRAEDGSIARFKVRLVARGFSQRYGVDYEETFAPTVKYDSLRLILSLAASEGLEVHQLDIENAYLAGELKEEIYMSPPDGIDLGGRVYKLQKSLYGLKQSARVWNKHLTDYLVSHGFTKADQDHSVLVSGGGIADPEGVIIPIYVDDMLIVSKSMKQINATKKILASKFKVKDLGEVRVILGTSVQRN
jgi:hypothetical protein